MSIKIMSLVWEKGPQNQAERFVLLALADFANDAGECWPSVDAIAAKTCLKERGVRQILRRLEDAGWLATAIGGGRHGCNNYRINPAPHAPLLGEKPGMVCPPAPNAPRHETTNTRHMTAQNPAPHAPEPSRTVKEPSTVRAALCAVMKPETADAWIAHRKAKRATMTPHAAELIAKKLAGRPDADDVVLHAIAQGWTGVYPPEAKPSQAKPSTPSRNEFWRKVAGAN